GPSGAYTGVIPVSFLIFDNVPTNSYVMGAFSAYAQDTWKAARRFTITYGLRWEVNPAPHSIHQAAVLNGPANPADASISSYVPAGKPFYATSWLSFAPRLGIGWQLHDGALTKTVLRLGGGRFFDLGQGGFDGQGFHAPTFLTYTNQSLG